MCVCDYAYYKFRFFISIWLGSSTHLTLIHCGLNVIEGKEGVRWECQSWPSREKEILGTGLHHPSQKAIQNIVSCKTEYNRYEKVLCWHILSSLLSRKCFLWPGRPSIPLSILADAFSSSQLSFSSMNKNDTVLKSLLLCFYPIFYSGGSEGSCDPFWGDKYSHFTVIYHFRTGVNLNES